MLGVLARRAAEEQSDRAFAEHDRGALVRGRDLRSRRGDLRRAPRGDAARPD
jgi:hypothetical protein